MSDSAQQGATSPSPPTEGAGERGVALLIVLWVVAAATMLVMTFNATVRSGLSFVHAEVGLSRSEAVLNAGVEIAVARLIHEDAGNKWRPDNQPRKVDFAGHRLRIRISDPNGLIDLNKADENLLLEFFKQFTSSDAAARGIRDKIKAARGIAEKANQNRANLAQKAASPGSDIQGSPNVPAFLDVGQARHLDGMSADLYRKVAPFLTVYSANGSINPLSAPNQVLSADPQLRGLDFTAKREAFIAGRMPASQTTVGTEPGYAETDSKDTFGPAYIIEVESGAPGERYTSKKTVVVAIGLDAEAPYRTLAVK